MNIVQYRREVDPLARPDAFKANWQLPLHTVFHFAFITATAVWLALGHIQHLPLWQWAAIALFTGHSVACLGFCAHELGHGAYTRRRIPMYLWEAFAWIYSLTICVSIHRKAHMMHHVFTNGVRDPNSRPTLAEVQSEGPVSMVLSEWLFPNAKHPWASAFAGLWIVNVAYQMKLLFHTLLRVGSRYDMDLPRREAWAGVAETFGLNLGVYLGLWALSGFSGAMLGYLCFMNYVGITLGLAYICTNHLINPSYDDHVDPLELTLSLKVPAWVDFLHQGFSHHNEHHLYPHAGPNNYEAIRQALLATYPERFSEMGFVEAYQLVLQTPLAVHDRTHRVDTAGQGVTPTILPAMNKPGSKGEPLEHWTRERVVPQAQEPSSLVS